VSAYAEKTVTYRVSDHGRVTRNGERRYAVLRTGPKGGTRLVSVWTNESIAYRVAEMLNTYSATEA
jgi:hypothetical protein